MKNKKLTNELTEHIPFTLIATAIAIILIIILKQLNISVAKQSFEILHPAHIFVSSIVTAGIFYKYKNKLIQSILIGITGAIIIGTMSDIIFPYLGSLIFNMKTQLHLPILEFPILILSTAFIGSFVGAKTNFTKIPHFLHVFLSVFASLFYLLSFSTITEFSDYLISFLIVFLAVIIPCCISDIIYPMIFVKEKLH